MFEEQIQYQLMLSKVREQAILIDTLRIENLDNKSLLASKDLQLEALQTKNEELQTKVLSLQDRLGGVQVRESLELTLGLNMRIDQRDACV